MLNQIQGLDPEHRERVAGYLQIQQPLVDAYPERLFLATCFFPHLTGIILNVGVMEMNKDDHLLLREPQLMRSLDTDPACALWGSPFGHETCDFFDWSQESELGGIAVFGAIGDRNDRSPDAAHIGLELADQVVQHAASLLASKGQLLLGIELNHQYRAARKRNIRTWERWIHQSNAMRDHFDEVQVFESRNNMIVTAKRSAETSEL